MKLVKHNIPDFPIPEYQHSAYGSPDFGQIFMDVVPGSTLKSTWSGLDDTTRERICRETWAWVLLLRQIPKPSEQSLPFQYCADGFPSHDVLIEDLQKPPRSLLDDAAVRNRIYERYRHYHGERFAKELPDMLPRLNHSAFTHGDISQNIMIDESHSVIGIIDWETAGWYPEYWEYANVVKPGSEREWGEWMDRTAPQRWNLEGIKAARRALF